MESEADAFICSALQQNGWLEGHAEDSTWTVSDLSSDAFIVVMLKFLAQVQSADDSVAFTLPSADLTAPVGVAARHRVGSKLANILKELGYAGDCGYNHFLYPNEKETRNILSWLVGKLPRSKLEENEDEDSKLQILDTIDAANTVLESKQLANIFSSWKQEKTSEKTTRMMFDGFPNDSITSTSLLEALAVEKRGTTMLLREGEFEEEVDMVALDIQGQIDDSLKQAASSFLPQEAETEDDEFTAIQPQSFDASALPNVPLSLKTPLSVSANAMNRESPFIGTVGSSSIEVTKVSEGNSDKEDHEHEQNEDQSHEKVQKHADDAERRITAMRKVLDHERGELHKVEQHLLETQSTGQEMQKQLARQKQLVAMLPQAQANMTKLEAICQKNAVKKTEIALQMESAREPLIKEYAELEVQKLSRKARCRQLVREIRAFRTEMVEITGIIHSKMESVRALEKVQERQMAKFGTKKDSEGGPMTRNMYTSRIMDIIKQVHKQKHDIAKILEDIKRLQKKLNITSEKLKRTEAVAEEKLYNAASKSKNSRSAKADAYVECYRKFAQVRELFEELISVVGDVGKKENAARDLQNWISQLEARDSSSQLDKVLADLESVRLENGTLQNELRARIA
ncbi:hypothetical protein PHPALM_28850 [Phytophthora palmivora]|uniref:Coiled-coil domain-containing protein 22 homolog n=1 Tax=Phytophthora palmivora TaxID=4796 RepID=A0A2P4X914_9STRA|nr:hypothetical protein PHPALM_28850 [Phytophthora palmivora]